MEDLVIRPGALGDTLLLLPGLMELKDRASISFVGRQPGIHFIRKAVRNVLDIEQGGWHRLFEERGGAPSLPVSRAGRVVAFFQDRSGKIQEGLEKALPGAEVHLFPSLPPEGERTHVALYSAGCLAAAGFPVHPAKAFHRAVNRSLLEQKDRPNHPERILFHPGSGAPRNNYHPHLWVRMMERLRLEKAFRIMPYSILLGPAEENLYPYFKERVASLGAEILAFPPKEVLADQLKEAILYVGHDSGVTHLAAMLGVPTVALFKASDTALWRPLGLRVRVVHAKEVSAGGLAEAVVSAAGSLLP